MAVIKCKMCGGELLITEGSTVAECEYCGTRQTIPNMDNEKKLTLFARANRLRAACEFDKAAGVYETIVADFPEEAEAYWGLVLCRYGIEYVDDPATGKKIPTCHRSSFDSVMDDKDFELVMEYSDAISRKVYREEAKQIEELRKSIIEVSGKEEPYDVFICYKETSDDGQRTIDSVLAQDIYEKLTDAGYRVFFSRITLEDKLGQEYEPYIFAALNSAKIMLAFGTDYEYFNAVWVKNEWSRFLKLMEKDKEKRLIPCYKDIDAYDMPNEFAKLQAQDMGKVGADQDLIRAIKKLLPKGEAKGESAPKSVVQQVVQSGPDAGSLLRRGQIFLSESEWDSAAEYFNKVLDIDPENSEAFFNIMLASARCSSKEMFEEAFVKGRITPDKNYNRAKRFSSSDNKEWFSFIEGKKEQIKAERRSFAAHLPKLISTSMLHTVGLKTDGTVLASGSNEYNQCDVSGWRHVTAIAAGGFRTFGLTAAGTVLAPSQKALGEINVENWTDIIMISAGWNHLVGLKKDGTVAAAGSNVSNQCDVSEWNDIISVAAGYYHTVGLKLDGTVVAVGNNYHGQCNVSGWENVLAVSAGYEHTIGLKGDGTVIACGKNDNGQCSVSFWTDIMSIAAGGNVSFGIKEDRTLVVAGANEDLRQEVSKWTDIVNITGTKGHIVGLRADGTLTCAGSSGFDRNYIINWKLFEDIDRLDEERSKSTRKRNELDIEQALKTKQALESRLAGTKGLFADVRRKKLEAEIAELDASISALQKELDAVN